MKGIFWLLLIAAVCAGVLYRFVLLEPPSRSLDPDGGTSNVSERAGLAEPLVEESSLDGVGDAPSKDQTHEPENNAPEPDKTAVPEVVVCLTSAPTEQIGGIT